MCLTAWDIDSKPMQINVLRIFVVPHLMLLVSVDNKNTWSPICTFIHQKLLFCYFRHFAYGGLYFSYSYSSTGMWTTLFYLAITNYRLSVSRRMWFFWWGWDHGLWMMRQSLLVTIPNRFLPHFFLLFIFLYCFPVFNLYDFCSDVYYLFILLALGLFYSPYPSFLR